MGNILQKCTFQTQKEKKDFNGLRESKVQNRKESNRSGKEKNGILRDRRWINKGRQERGI